MFFSIWPLSPSFSSNIPWNHTFRALNSPSFPRTFSLFTWNSISFYQHNHPYECPLNSVSYQHSHFHKIAKWFPQRMKGLFLTTAATLSLETPYWNDFHALSPNQAIMVYNLLTRRTILVLKMVLRMMVMVRTYPHTAVSPEIKALLC